MKERLVQIVKINESLKAVSVSIIIDVKNHKGKEIDCHFTIFFHALLFSAFGYFKFIFLFNE